MIISKLLLYFTFLFSTLKLPTAMYYLSIYSKSIKAIVKKKLQKFLKIQRGKVAFLKN